MSKKGALTKIWSRPRTLFFGVHVEAVQSTKRFSRFGSRLVNIPHELIVIFEVRSSPLAGQLIYGPCEAFDGPLVFITEPMAFAFV